MDFDLNKFKEAISTIITSIEYIEGVTDDFKKITHSVHPLQREIKELENLIRTNYGLHDENIIKQLIEKKEELSLKLSTINDTDLMYNQVIEYMYDFVQQYNFRPGKLKKYTDKEIVFLYDLYLFEKKTTFTQCMRNLNQYIQNSANCHLIELINSQLQLTGFNRFYLKDDIVMSYYCNDLKNLIKDMSSKSQFHLLETVVHKHRGEARGLISPSEILKAIISYFNRRKADIQNPHN